jgi:hypothetical protein
MSDDELEQEVTQREAAMIGLQPYQVRANRAVPDSLVRDIVADSRRGPTAPSSLASSVQSEKPRPLSGGSVPIQPPPGLNYVDQQVNAATRREYLIRAQQIAELQWIEDQLAKKTTYRAKTEYDHLKRYDDAVPSLHREKE